MISPREAQSQRRATAPVHDAATSASSPRRGWGVAAFALVAGSALLLAATAGRSSAASTPPVRLPDNVPPAAASLRQLCSFANDDAHAAKIQGADGGSSVLVGDKSYWLFGDTLLLPESGRQIQANALAWSTTRNADGCPVLAYYSQAGSAAQFLQKDGSLTVWPSGAWPVDDHTFDFYTVYVYGSGPFAYRIGEVGLARLDTRTMEVQTLSRGLWNAESGFARQVIGAQPIEVAGDGLLRVILGTSDGDQLLARVAPRSLAVDSAYEFWDGQGWSSDPARAATLWPHVEPSSDPVQRLASFNNGVNIAYNAYLGKYIAVQNIGFDKIGARVADHLEGPWSAPTAWVDCSAIAGPDVPVCYSPYQHPQLSSADGRTILLTFTRKASYDVVAYEVTLGAPPPAAREGGSTPTSAPSTPAAPTAAPSTPTPTPGPPNTFAPDRATTPPTEAGNAPAATTSPIPRPPHPWTTATPVPGAPADALVATGSIAGKVTNALGTPIAGANVYACCYVGTATTAADGTYVITGLAPGSYIVPVFATGYAPTLYNGTYEFNTATRVPVTSGAITPNIDFALAAAANVAGKVTNALGTPVAGAALQACPETAGYCNGATSAGDGTYTINDLAPGRYRVEASASGYAPQTYNGTYDYNLRTLVSATSGVTTPNINFALAPGASITGKVTNALGTPIAGASVSASASSCCASGSATSAGDGTYTINDLAPGSYRVQAVASGYASQYYNGTYNYNAATLVPATSGVTTPNINFALALGASIAGKVTNALGTPIAGASVYANRSGCCGYGSATSAGDGTYTINDLAPGSYRVQALALGYASQYYNGTYDYSAATLVSATSGATTPNIDFALAAGGSIAGKVTNALGTPIAGANVSANASPCCSYGGATTAADGTYVITGLPPNTYRVYASGPYCAPGAASPPCVSYLSQYYNGTYDYNAATLVTAASGATTPNIDFSLAEGGRIAGKVTNALATPIAGAGLQACPVAFGYCGSATTGADGTYLITGLVPGDYRVYASCASNAVSPPCGSYAPQYYNGTSDYNLATLVPASSGVTTPNINFALAEGGRIAGKVTNALGTPIAGAGLQACPVASGYCGSATTGADGIYLITGLVPGDYRVHASCASNAVSPPCGSYAPQYYNGTYDYSAATLVPATSGTTTPNINFALALGGSISGKVTNALGTPIAGAGVSANASTCCGYGYATTGADGTYVITGLPPNTYRVYASAPYCAPGAVSPPCVSYASQYYNGTYDYSLATLVSATSGATTPNIDFALALGGSIAGKVTNALGTPIAGASVSANASTCCGYGYATTGADGTYVITGLPANTYRVYASAPYCAPGAVSPPCVSYASQYYNGAYDVSAATMVPATSGGTTPNINFALALSGSIAGKVTDPLGTPVAGAWINADRNAGGSGGWATSAADGTYLISGLAPGSYVVSASVPSCPPPSSPPAVGPCTPYPVWFYNGVCEYLSATPVAVPSGGTSTSINITLRPANPDCFDHAVPIGALGYTDTRSTEGATTAPGETLPCGAMGATVWYEYTAAPSPAAYNTTSVDTVGSNFNTAVAVYSQGVSPPGVLSLIACKSDASGSLVSFTAAPGTRYYFQIGGQTAATGQLTVHVSPDTDGDGYTDIQETRLGKNPASFCAIMRADVNGDGVVNSIDLAKTARNYGRHPGAREDQNNDGTINSLDLLITARRFGQRVTACT